MLIELTVVFVSRDRWSLDPKIDALVGQWETHERELEETAGAISVKGFAPRGD